MIDFTLRCILDTEIKNYDSMFRSHDIRYVYVNRSLFHDLSWFYSFVILLSERGYLSKNDFNHYHCLIKSRLLKLDKNYFI